MTARDLPPWAEMAWSERIAVIAAVPLLGAACTVFGLLMLSPVLLIVAFAVAVLS